ncbi:MAG: hypothetical protein AAF721_27465 [Myxococcota bacterium]
METQNRPLRLRPLPRPARPTFERRQHRSENAGDALRLAMNASARRGALDAVLLVDEEGMLVAQSDCDVDLAMLAAVTPIVGRGRAVPKIRRDGKKLDLTVGTMEVLDEVVYVAVLGGSRHMRSRALMGTAAAAKRILA